MAEPRSPANPAVRYHPLFAEFLRECLSRQGEWAELHLRASAWHERHGALAKAIDHALEAKAWERAAGLIERGAASGVDVSRWLAQMPQASGALVAPLSDREAEILHLILSGMSNPEIAHRLIIAVSTVKTHVKSILGKLGVRDRTQAVVWAYRTGFVGE